MDNKKIQVSLKTIFKGGLITLGGTAIGILLNFLFKVIAARHFGPEDYGWFSITLAVVLIGATISDLGMSQSVARFIPFFKERNEPEKLSYIVSFGVKLSLTASLVLSIAIFIVSPWLSRFLHGEANFTVFLVFFAMVIPFEVIFNFSLGILRGMKDMKMMALCNSVILWGARLALLGLIVIIGLDVEWMVLPYFVSYVLALTVSWTYIIKRGTLSGKSGFLFTGYRNPGLRKDFISYSLPLVFSTITVMFHKRFDLILVALFLTAPQVGLYNVALPLAGLMTVFLFAINRIAMPVASGLFSGESEQEMNYVYKSIAKWSLMISLPIFFVLFSFPERIIDLFFGEEYLGAANALRILAAGFFLNSISGSFGEYLQSYSKTKSIFIISLTGSVISLALMVILIPRFGIEGAALSISASQVWMCLLGNVYMYHYKRVLPFSSEYLSTILIGVVIFSGVYLLQARLFAFANTYLFVGMVGASLMLYAAMLYFFATNEFDKEIIRAIRKRSALAWQGASQLIP